MASLGLFVAAGVLEIGGGYLVWIWLRDNRSAAYGVLGFLLLAGYGIVPVFQPKAQPFGRIYAAYGAVFIVGSLLWGWAVDSRRPDLRDWVGASVAGLGALIMMWPRGR
jgi:small multidrug resistance family-3 protein